MNSALDLSHDVGVKPACKALGVNRDSFYRALAPHDEAAQSEAAKAAAITERC